MAEVDLTQAEADELIALPKHRKDARPWAFPLGGGSIAIPLVSQDGRHEFRLDIRRARFDLPDHSYQIRSWHTPRCATPLVRLDIGGEFLHGNPDGARVPEPHVHRYREGDGDDWAEPVPEGAFQDLEDPIRTLHDFMRYCNVVEAPNIQVRLFDD